MNLSDLKKNRKKAVLYAWLFTIFFPYFKLTVSMNFPSHTLSTKPPIDVFFFCNSIYFTYNTYVKFICILFFFCQFITRWHLAVHLADKFTKVGVGLFTNYKAQDSASCLPLLSQSRKCVLSFFNLEFRITVIYGNRSPRLVIMYRCYSCLYCQLSNKIALKCVCSGSCSDFVKAKIMKHLPL